MRKAKKPGRGAKPAKAKQPAKARKPAKPAIAAVKPKAPKKPTPARKSAAKPRAVKSPPPRVDPAVAAPLGAHVSTAGGCAKAPARAMEIGATAMQVFTKTPNQWKEREVSPEEAAAFRAELAKTPVRFANAHDSYLINLASPDVTLRARSIESFAMELRRCHALGLDALVSHPGNFIDDRASGIARNADGIVEAFESAPGPTRLLMELTAGQGSVIGSTFEEMAELLQRLPMPLRERVGVCLDTAHVFAAGYDLANDYDGVWERFGGIIGFHRLGLLHLNDSAAPLGAKRDRHALIGEGMIGQRAFERIMDDERLAGIPKVLETPKGEDLVTNDRRMIGMLRSFGAG